MERQNHIHEPHQERILSPHEVDLSSEKFSVIKNITNTEGYNPIYDYIADFANSGGILLVTGEAGSGKTTIGIQIEEAIKETAGKKGVSITTNKLLFDRVYSELEEEYGSREHWNPQIWSLLNKEIYKKSFNVHPRDSDYKKVHFTRIEFPMAGAPINPEELRVADRYIGDRGIEAGKLFANETKTRFGRNIKFLYGIPDPALQKRAGYLRPRVLEQPPTQVLHYLHDHNIRFSDIDLEDLDRRRKRNIGLKIQDVYSRMAKSVNIENVRYFEVAAEADYQYKFRGDHDQRVARIREFLPYSDSGIDRVLSEFGLGREDGHREAEIISRSAKIGYYEQVLNTAAYAEFKIHSQLGLDRARAHAIFNPTDVTKPITIPLSSFLH